MSDRVFALVWLALCAVAAGIGWQIEAAFSYEPIGPRAYPLLVIVLMALCAGCLACRRGDRADWPSAATLGRLSSLALLLLAYAAVFEWLGFPLASALLIVGIGRLFGGGWLACLLLGVISGIGLYYGFDRLLDVTLPAGRLLDR